MSAAASAAPADARGLDRSAGLRPFRIVIGNCLRCGREWPAHVESCRECAVALGEPRLIRGIRLVPASSYGPAAPALAIVISIELSRRGSDGDRWAERVLAAVVPELAGAIGVGPGPAGSIVSAFSLTTPESVAEVAERALALLDCARGAGGAELRGGIVVGAVGVGARTGSAGRLAERLALAAAPGQWLVSADVAHRLKDRFELRPVGPVPRWPMSVPRGHRALVGPLTPPLLPSAVRGAPPELVLGRGPERRRLSVELAAAAAGQRRVVLVSAPAGGGKSYLLRRVLADSGVALAAGVAFPPLGSRPLDPLRALLAELAGPAEPGSDHGSLGAALAAAAAAKASGEPAAIVIDDIHWAGPTAVATLTDAIATTDERMPLAWILAARTSALASLVGLAGLADVTVQLPPLANTDRTRLLAHRLGTVPDGVRAHACRGAERGNPLYLEHLAAAIREGCAEERLPGSLHEAVLVRLDGLADRARQLARWSSLSANSERELQALEREAGDWLDRLETSDLAERHTIGRYLARLQAVDLELVIARSILRLPVPANRRVGQALERLAAASTDALLGYLEATAGEGRSTQATRAARAAAERAEQGLRLPDAARLLEFVARYDHAPALARQRGDLALALGDAEAALDRYHQAAFRSRDDGELERRTARAEALRGDAERASARLARLLGQPALEPGLADRARLDLARLRGLPPPARRGSGPDQDRCMTRALAWARVGDPRAACESVRALALAGGPVECAAELTETAALARLAGLGVDGLDAAAARASALLGNPRADALLNTADESEARRTFLHWYV